MATRRRPDAGVREERGVLRGVGGGVRVQRGPRIIEDEAGRAWEQRIGVVVIPAPSYVEHERSKLHAVAREHPIPPGLDPERIEADQAGHLGLVERHIRAVGVAAQRHAMMRARSPLELRPAVEPVLPRPRHRGAQAARGPAAQHAVRIEAARLDEVQVGPVGKRHRHAGIGADRSDDIVGDRERHAVRSSELERRPLHTEAGVARRELGRRGERGVDQLVAREREVHAEAQWAAVNRPERMTPVHHAEPGRPAAAPVQRGVRDVRAGERALLDVEQGPRDREARPRAVAVRELRLAPPRGGPVHRPPQPLTLEAVVAPAPAARPAPLHVLWERHHLGRSAPVGPLDQGIERA